MSYSIASHTKYYHRYHVVWTTKYRYNVLQGSLRERLRTIIRQTCDELDVHIVRGVLARDHIHMFVSIPPKQSLSDVMQKIKGRSSRRLQMEFPYLRKRYWGKRFWARGISLRPLAMSPTKLSCATWNYIPEQNDTSGFRPEVVHSNRPNTLNRGSIKLKC